MLMNKENIYKEGPFLLFRQIERIEKSTQFKKEKKKGFPYQNEIF